MTPTPLRALLIALASWLLTATAAQAHEVRPAYLELAETAPHSFSAVWKQPVTDGLRLQIDPVFPQDCARENERLSTQDGVLVSRWTLECDLLSQALKIEGLDRTLTDVFVRVTTLDGEEISAVLRPGASRLDFARPSSPARAYFRIGVEHIWFGFDHLLFVLGVMLLVRPAQLLGTVTAFTVAHSLTLGLSALGFAALPGPPVEIVIALSITLLGVETVHHLQGRDGIAIRRPWLLAGGFGLIHGFGFAGALSEIGLPKSAELLALFLFNLGVEAGQIAVIASVLALVWIVNAVRAVPFRTLRYVGAYGIGIIGMHWTIERCAATFA